MIPRSEVIWVEQGMQLADFLSLYAENPLSRYPVYKDNRDNVIGIISVKDVLMAIARGSLGDDHPIDSLIRPAYFTPETKPIDELLAEMQTKNTHLAIVVNEYGGTAGLIRLNLLLGRIVGPIRDEMAGEQEARLVGDNTYQIAGNMRIDEANAVTGLDIPEGDYETVAGFILSRLGHIPRPYESLRYKDLSMTVSEMDGRKIEKVLVTREVEAANP
jgi:putative hemolysin